MKIGLVWRLLFLGKIPNQTKPDSYCNSNSQAVVTSGLSDLTTGTEGMQLLAVGEFDWNEDISVSGYSAQAILTIKKPCQFFIFFLHFFQPVMDLSLSCSLVWSS